MDVYHKVLARIYEVTGGKDSVEVDLADIVKREGFYSNIQSISEHLKGESWVAEGSRPLAIKMTHWGIAEARRVAANLPNRSELVAKDAARLVSEGREFLIMLEDLAAHPSESKLTTVGKRHAELGTLLK